jgi:glycosyltransferase involved in cell wall biosynthesis
MQCALIIATYKQPVYLAWLLDSLMLQARIPDEVIVAEDDNSPETALVVERYRLANPTVRVKHVFHEDAGFRKSTTLNKAVAQTTCEKLVFLDGDCLPHPKMMYQYEKNLKPGVMLFGRPVYLPGSFFEQFTARTKPFRFSLFELIFNKARSIEAGIYLPFLKPKKNENRAMQGSGWGCMRIDYIAVNGFDENFNIGQYGFEDTDLNNRMKRAGILCLIMKNIGIYYHLGRPGVGDAKTEEKTAVNRRLLQKNDDLQVVRCINGVSQWLNPTDRT